MFNNIISQIASSISSNNNSRDSNESISNNIEQTEELNQPEVIIKTPLCNKRNRATRSADVTPEQDTKKLKETDRDSEPEQSESDNSDFESSSSKSDTEVTKNCLVNMDESRLLEMLKSQFKESEDRMAYMITTKLKPIEESIRKFYSNLFSKSEESESEETTNITKKEDPELDNEFDFSELNYAIKNLSKNKSAGTDTITNELWINLSSSHRLMLLDCINECWRNNKTPASWSEIVLAPIYKKGVKTDPSNYRPISLVNTIVKLLTSLMTNRLNDWCEKYNKVTEFQAAYRKGVGCEDHVFTLNAIIQNHLKNKKNVMFALFIDLSKAFDSVNHMKLWNKLASIGISTKFIGIIKCLYRNA
jgi:hypothetical protein